MLWFLGYRGHMGLLGRKYKVRAIRIPLLHFSFMLWHGDSNFLFLLHVVGFVLQESWEPHVSHMYNKNSISLLLLRVMVFVLLMPH